MYDAAGMLSRVMAAQDAARAAAEEQPFTPLDSYTGDYRNKHWSTWTLDDYGDEYADQQRFVEQNRDSIAARAVDMSEADEDPDLLDSLGYMGAQRPGEFRPVEGGPQTFDAAMDQYYGSFADNKAKQDRYEALRLEAGKGGRSMFGNVVLGLAGAAIPGLGPMAGLGLLGSGLFGAATGAALTRAQGGDALQGALMGGLSGAGASLAAGGGGEAIQGVIDDVADATGLANEQVVQLAESVAQGADAEDVAASLISANIQGRLPDEIVIEDVFREGASTIPSAALGGFVDLGVDAAFGEDIGASDIAGAAFDYFDRGGDLGFLTPTLPSVGDLFPEFMPNVDLDLRTPGIVSDIGDALGRLPVPDLDFQVPNIPGQISESIDLPPNPQFSESIDLPGTPESDMVLDGPELPSVDTPDLDLPDVPGLPGRGSRDRTSTFDAEFGDLFAYTPFQIYRKGMFK